MAHRVSGYVSPFGRGLTKGQVDQGVDYGGAGKLYAIGDAILERVSGQGTGTGWPGAGGTGAGAMIVYRLLSGPDAGKRVYLAENVDPVAGLKKGDTVRAGQQIATARGAYPFLETGWAADGSGTTLAQQQYGGPIPSSVRHAPGGTAAGRAFAAFIANLTGKGQNATDTAGAGSGSATERTIVNRAAAQYHVRADVLWGIYGAESSWGKAKSSFGLTGDYPGVGTSGDFTTDAFRSAQILRNLLDSNNQSYEKALRKYSGGGYGMQHIQDLMGGGTSAAGKMAPFGRTRPGGANDPAAGGGGASTDGAGVNAEFASYVGLFGGLGPLDPTNLLPGFNIPGIPNPLDLFQGGADAISGTVDFLKWISWIFNPKNILRAVEFVTGLIIMAFGLHSMYQVYRDAPEQAAAKKAGSAAKRGTREAFRMTPAGRALSVRKAKRFGRASERRQVRMKETGNAARKAAHGERNRIRSRGADRKARRSREPAPF